MKTILTTGWLPLCCIFVLPVFFEAPAAANALLVTYDCSNGSAATTYAPAGALSFTVPVPCSATSGGTITTTYPTTTNYLTSTAGLGSVIHTSTGGLIDTEALAEDALSITSNTLAPGTPVALTFFVSPLTGSYAFSNNYFTFDEISASVNVNSALVTKGAADVVICTVAVGIPVNGTQPCDEATVDTYYSNPTLVVGVSGSGTLAIPIGPGTYDTTVGTTGLPLSVGFDQHDNVNGGGSSFTGDFLDPFTIMDIEATDPTTGHPLSGISITGASGVSYPVNISAVPEPSTLPLIIVALLALAVCARLAAHDDKRASTPPTGLKCAFNPYDQLV